MTTPAELIFILGATAACVCGFLFMVGALSKDIILCLLGFHRLDRQPERGCIGILRCTRRHEYDTQCQHTVVYNWSDR